MRSVKKRLDPFIENHNKNPAPQNEEAGIFLKGNEEG